MHSEQPSYTKQTRLENPPRCRFTENMQSIYYNNWVGYQVQERDINVAKWNTSSAHTEIPRRKILEQFLENSGDSDKREAARHTRTIRIERPTRPQHGDTRGGLNTHTHTSSGSCATKWSRWMGIPQWSLALAHDEQGSAACLGTLCLTWVLRPPPRPPGWISWCAAAWSREPLVQAGWSQAPSPGEGKRSRKWSWNTVKQNYTILTLKSFILVYNFLH